MTGLNDKGKFLGITKEDMIRVGKEKRQGAAKAVWSKQVASTFGATLKRLNSMVALEKKRDEAEEKMSRAGYLQQFGCLYGDSYSLKRVIKSQGLVPGVRFVRIDCGGQHASALTADGDVYTWGAGSFGQLGHGNRASRDNLSKVENLPKCTWIACGYAFTCSVSVDGEMFAWGAGENGRLGTGDTVDICLPTKVQAEWKAKKIFAGSVHTCALSESSELYSWGHRNYTGHGGTVDVLLPKKLETFEGKLCHMASIGPGGYHTMALTVSGSVYTWGHNRVGQLGFDNDSQTTQTAEGAFFYPVPRFVSALAGMQIRAVSAGWGHSAVLNYNGEVYMCGRNYRGQVGMEPAVCPRNERGHPYLPAFTLVEGLAGQKVEQIACGGEHTAAVTSEGNLYLWGDDACAQLGHAKMINEEYGSGKQRYKWAPHLVEGAPVVGDVVHIALGSAVTFLLSGTNE
jgi:alpha-tubulin suppressor-like RCC1 family protein